MTQSAAISFQGSEATKASSLSPRPLVSLFFEVSHFSRSKSALDNSGTFGATLPLFETGVIGKRRVSFKGNRPSPKKLP